VVVDVTEVVALVETQSGRFGNPVDGAGEEVALGRYDLAHDNDHRTTAGLKARTMTATHKAWTTVDGDFQPTQVYQVFIKANAERIWEAITTPGFTQRYFHGARITVSPDSYRSLGPDDSVWGDEKVYEYDPPRRLVHGWTSRYDVKMGQEPPAV